MMRCSGSSRDFSMESGEEFVYKNLREESPPGEALALTNNNNHHRLKPNLCHGVNINNNNNKNNYQMQQHQQQQQRQQQPQQRQYEHFVFNHAHEQINAIPKRCVNCDSKRHSLGNGAINGAATISHMWQQRKDSAASLQSADSIDGVVKPKSMKINRRKNSIGCLNSLSSSPKSPNGYYTISSSTPPTKCKSQSLPPHASIKNLDPVIISALRIPSEELANQLTLLDLPIFAAIQPDEMTSCSWTKKEKHLVAPNIVKFTKRFNHTSFWTVQEILSGEHSKQRAKILTHFIKVAKKLHELNNLHSLYAIISAMQSASIYRLNRTWSCISKKDKQSFDRLRDIFGESDHFKNLREYLESLRLPCIPYLGIFLSDLIYIDTAHPYRGGLESASRRNQMNNILRVIANYQQSTYEHLIPNEAIQKYLTSIRFIEELQNIFEEDQYKRSLKLEPQSNCGPSSSSCSSKESLSADGITPALACLNISPAKTLDAVRVTSNGGAMKFLPGHRKCRSLGTKFRSTSLPRSLYHKCQCSIMMIAPGLGTISNKRCKCRIFGKITYNGNGDGGIVTTCHESADLPCAQQIYSGNGEYHKNYQQAYNLNHSVPYQQRHLLDDSVLETCPQHGTAAIIMNSTRRDTNPHCHAENAEAVICDHNETISTTTTTIINIPASLQHSLQGYVRRKTVQKEGRKATMASWQRYWLQIWSNSLVYFSPKSFKGSERADFRQEPCKVCPLEGWQAKVVKNTKHKNSFELYHAALGTIYKFRTDSPQATQLWAYSICKVTIDSNRPMPLPVNLMSFE